MQMLSKKINYDILQYAVEYYTPVAYQSSIDASSCCQVLMIVIQLVLMYYLKKTNKKEYILYVVVSIIAIAFETAKIVLHYKQYQNELLLSNLQNIASLNDLYNPESSKFLNYIEATNNSSSNGYDEYL